MPVTLDRDCFDPGGSMDPDLDGLDDDDFDPAQMTGHSQQGWEADPHFRVVTDTVDRAADALLVAAERFMLVGVSGKEYASGETGPANGRGDYTPNISRVTADNEAAYLIADTNGWLSHEMAATMKRILVEELTRVEVSALISADYNPIRGVAAERWPRKQQ